MSEAQVLEMLGAARDAARSRGMFRLAEHLDDAMLVAASEYYEAAEELEFDALDDGQGAETIRGVGEQRVH